MAGPGARIRECLPCFWNELPVIALGMKSELQHSKRVTISYFTVGLGLSKDPVRVFPSTADYKLANAVESIQSAIRILRCKALVIVIVAVDDYIRARVIERIPQGFHQRIVSVRTAGTE